MGKNSDHRDDRRLDATQYNLTRLAKVTDRDYSAHFFRWSFVKRLIRPTDYVLDVGCGDHRALYSILTGGMSKRFEFYTGVDAAPLKPIDSIRAEFKGDFDFTERWHELRDGFAFDVVVCLEVIEHVRVDLGKEMLHGCFELLQPGGSFVLSTPVYDGKRQYDIHVHEYTVPEIRAAIESAGFKVLKVYGNWMHLRHLTKLSGLNAEDASAVNHVHALLREYFDNDALSCFFAPLFPDFSKNCVWHCTK